jgi:hypothetical protein
MKRALILSASFLLLSLLLFVCASSNLGRRKGTHRTVSHACHAPRDERAPASSTSSYETYAKDAYHSPHGGYG